MKASCVKYVRFVLLCFALMLGQRGWAQVVGADNSNVVVLEKKELVTRYILPTKNKWNKVAAQLTEGCTTPYEKAKAIYSYLAATIAYDTSYTVHSPDTCWETKIGVCQAYCNLFYQIGKCAGLDVRIVFGSTKDVHGSFFNNNHSWIVVSKNPLDPKNPNLMPESHTEKGYGIEDLTWNLVSTRGMTAADAIIIDPTWGAGSVNQGAFIRNDHDYSWFDVDPYWMIFTHLPNSPEDQLLPTPVGKEEFLTLPPITPLDNLSCWEAKKCYEHAKNGGDFPVFYSGNNAKLGYEELPMDKEMHVGKEYTIRLKKTVNLAFAVWNGTKFDTEAHEGTDWKAEGDIRTIKFMPIAEGDLFIGVQSPTAPDSYIPAVSYTVPTPTRDELLRLEQANPFDSPLMKSFPAFDHKLAQRRGIDPNDLLDKVRGGSATGMPVLYECEHCECQIIDMPFRSSLTSGASYTISFKPIDNCAWALHDGTKFYKEWTIDPETGVHSMQFTPVTDRMSLLARPEGENSYYSLLEYSVK